MFADDTNIFAKGKYIDNLVNNIVTFGDSTLNTAILCPAISVVNFLLIYCTVLYLDFARWSILDV